ncbi:hypothetical protein ACFQ0M_06140 [Kitasatospora aburaviensis]
MKARPVVLIAAALVLLGGSLGYVLHARQRGDGPRLVAAESSFTLDAPGLYYRDGATGRVARSPGAADGPSCVRFYAAGDRALCLRALPGTPARTQAVVYDRRFTELQTVTVPGIPNRARVSASGHLLSWTTFAVGDSYAAGTFSTRTSILDLRTGYLVKSIESVPLTVDGTRYHAADVNYWGVTFAADDNRFYATVSTGGRTHLVEGDLKAWSARTLRRTWSALALAGRHPDRLQEEGLGRPGGALAAPRPRTGRPARAPAGRVAQRGRPGGLARRGDARLRAGAGG